jgi:hypothetical protein
LRKVDPHVPPHDFLRAAMVESIGFLGNKHLRLTRNAISGALLGELDSGVTATSKCDARAARGRLVLA